jgi:hypothetical protein
MNVFTTIIVSGLTTMAMATFSTIASFLVNRYLPRVLDNVEHKFKKLDK